MTIRNIFGDLDIDSYKLSHYLQTPEGITNISSYIEPRSAGHDDGIVYLGLQGWLDTVLSTITIRNDVDYLKGMGEAHGLPVNGDIYDLVGKPLPLRIQALPEGTVVKPGTALVQVTNTDPRFPWLTSLVETSLLRAIWYPTTVATNSRRIKKIIKRYLEKTADTTDGLPFKLHDFGFRGVSSYESGCIGGFAHLVNFMGTDTMGALKYAFDCYGAEEMPGFSIPAAEHSTITSWGRDGEADAYANMVDKFAGPGKLYAVVSDSYDIYNACEHLWGELLKTKVEEAKGTLVVRPDSGDPLVVVPKILEILGDKFGTKTNSKGYRVLADCVRVIQGDGVNLRTIDSLLGKMQVHGWSADNLAFGMGGALLQDVTRDDLSFAMKASALSSDGGQTWTDFRKDPKTMSSKKSKAGRLLVIPDSEGELITVNERGAPEGAVKANVLTDVWIDGHYRQITNLEQIRARAAV